jgi:hypothetical protein
MELKRNPKAPSNNRSWSTSDDSTLIKMARGGASASEIAKILGRTIMAVTTRKHTLRVDVRLASSKGKGVDVPKSLSVKNRKKRKELPVVVISRTLAIQSAPMDVTKNKISRKSWTNDDDSELLLLAANGNSLQLIGGILGRTTAAVALRKSALKKSGATQQKTETLKVDNRKAAMLLRMEKMGAAKGKNKNLPMAEKVAPISVAKEEKIPSMEQSVSETDFDALSRIAKRTGATITVVFNK